MGRAQAISNLRDSKFMNNLFPFYILMDKEMKILNKGRSINQLLDFKPELGFFGQFKIQMPLYVDDYLGIVKNRSSLFIFSSIEAPSMKFRGQFYFEEKNELVCFFGTPLINSFEDLEDKNLQLSDFAIHDSINQFLFTLQMHISSLANAQDLANKFKLSNIKLKDINDSLDSLIYKLTHDLRSPAINIKSMLIMLSDFIEISKGSEAQQIYDNSLLATQTLLKTIEDFLELSRLEKMENRMLESCDVSTIINEIISENSMLIESNKVSVLLKLNGMDVVVGVYDDIKSIFQNLITNSIKYRAKGRAPKIELSATKKGRYTQFLYADNGIGIDLERQGSKLFKMFSRLHSNPNISGTGIGLYLVKKLTLRNNGLVEISSSQLNKGTAFTIHLPHHRDEI